jgi:hypothetical protein
MLFWPRIARNVANFEIWSTHQGCEQVSYSDLPKEVKADIAKVFDVTGRLPKAWTRKVCLILVLCMNDLLRDFVACRSQRNTSPYPKSRLPLSLLSFPNVMQQVPACSLPVLIMQTLRTYTLKFPLYIPHGNACSACEVQMKNGPKQIMLPMCKHLLSFICYLF